MQDCKTLAGDDGAMRSEAAKPNSKLANTRADWGTKPEAQDADVSNDESVATLYTVLKL